MTVRTTRRYLVTGGAGFLGSHLCDRLLAAGHAVLCVDDLTTGRYRNVAQHADNPAFMFCQHDVILPLDVDSVADIDGIFHLACPASPVHYQRDPVRTTQTAVVGTLNMLDVARRAGVPLLHASTSEIYGDPLNHPQCESDWGHANPIGPRACYDEGKRCAESLCFDYHRQFGVAVKVARIFNTYGPRMQVDDGRVVSNFISQALRGEAITLYGDGRQTRSFCYVDDLIAGLIRLMSTDYGVTGPFNLGNPVEVSMLALAERIRRLTGARGGVVHLPPPADDPVRRRPDIQRARDALGWSPATALDDGLRLTIDFLRQEIGRDCHARLRAV